MLCFRDAEPEPEPEPPEPAHFGRSGAGAGAVGTFCSEPEPSKKVSVLAPKRGKHHKKKTQSVKRENAESIIFIALFVPFPGTGEFE